MKPSEYKDFIEEYEDLILEESPDNAKHLADYFKGVQKQNQMLFMRRDSTAQKANP